MESLPQPIQERRKIPRHDILQEDDLTDEQIKQLLRNAGDRLKGSKEPCSETSLPSLVVQDKSSL